MRYRLDLLPSALRAYRSLPRRIRVEIAELFIDLIDDPSIGKPLDRELINRFTIPVDGYRLIYKVDEQDRSVLILAIRVRGQDTYLNLA